MTDNQRERKTDGRISLLNAAYYTFGGSGMMMKMIIIIIIHAFLSSHEVGTSKAVKY